MWGHKAAADTFLYNLHPPTSSRASILVVVSVRVYRGFGLDWREGAERGLKAFKRVLPSYTLLPYVRGSPECNPHKSGESSVFKSVLW